MWSELFLTPFLTGLVLAVLLPLVGVYLRLRREWLVALAASHVAAAGALAASLLGFGGAAGGLLGALLIGAAKPALLGRLKDGAAYPLLFLLGWAASVLLAANHPLAERLGHALFDGQLYFAGSGELTVGLLAIGPVLLALRLLSRRLLLERLYPDHLRLQGAARWPAAAFDLLAALCVAGATMTLGVMGCFALVFVPAWAAFNRAESWRGGLLWAVGLGVVAYLAAFVAALSFDQPFGPVLAVATVLLGLVVLRRD